MNLTYRFKNDFNQNAEAVFNNDTFENIACKIPVSSDHSVLEFKFINFIY